MDRIEKRLEHSYNYWLSIAMYSQDYDSGYRWVAEYYRDGLTQYRMLHNPVVPFITQTVEEGWTK